ncbi:MAG: AzlD domain-containing protein [Spirochaetaceae bacterium]|jgi:branched-subunit amino acid transport protein AzlD|nr:AzlD domain-containing protein [Spirochaetaceae bacterium]
MLPLKTAVLYSALSGVVVLLCRAFPFIFLADGKNPLAKQRTFVFVAEKIIPPLAMVLLCVNAIVSPVRENPVLLVPVAAASLLTALLHLLRRNVLLSIAGGTVCYMVLIRVC